MFTREELVTRLAECVAASSPPLGLVEFWSRDFVAPCSEQCIEVVLGAKTDFPTGLMFWIKALQAQAGRDGSELTGYAEAGLCEPLARHEFAAFVSEYSRSLKRELPPSVINLEGFRSGLRMYADWNDVAAVAELEHEFVAFFWWTTA